jgi:hypothetical protein
VIRTPKVIEFPITIRYLPTGAGRKPEKPIVNGQVPVATIRWPGGSSTAPIEGHDGAMGPGQMLTPRLFATVIENALQGPMY